MAIASDLPASRRARAGPTVSARRPRTVAAAPMRRADEEAGLPQRGRRARPRRSVRSRHAGTPSSIALDVDEAVAEQPSGQSRGRRQDRRSSAGGGSAGRLRRPSWPARPAIGGRPRVVPGASSPLIESSSPERRPWPWPSRRSRPGRRPTARMAGREQRVVGAARGAACRSPRRRRQREDEVAVRVALAEERRPATRATDRLDVRAAQPAGLDQRAPGRAWRARRPRSPGSRP